MEATLTKLMICTTHKMALRVVTHFEASTNSEIKSRFGKVCHIVVRRTACMC